MSNARTITIHDRMEIPKGFSQRKVNDATGVLKAPGVMARAGIQLYRARELGITDVAPDTILKIYRSPETLADAAESFEDCPLTMGHPPISQYPKGVTADNWKELSVGHINRVKVSNGLMRGSLSVSDAEAVEAVQMGTAELSNSYTCKLTMDGGADPSGAPIDGEQTDITGNHCAIIIKDATTEARGGAICRVLDQGETMGKRIVIVTDAKGKSEGVELEDVAAAIVDRLQDQLATANKLVADAATTHKAALDAVVLEKDKLIADARALILSPAQVLTLVADRASVVNDCAAICPEVKVSDDMTTDAIRRAMLTDLIGKSETAKRVSDAVIPGGLKDETPAATIKTALDAAKVMLAKSVEDGITQDGITSRGLCPREPVGDNSTPANGDKSKPVGRAAYVANLTHPSAKAGK